MHSSTLKRTEAIYPQEAMLVRTPMRGLLIIIGFNLIYFPCRIHDVDANVLNYVYLLVRINCNINTLFFINTQQFVSIELKRNKNESS